MRRVAREGTLDQEVDRNRRRATSGNSAARNIILQHILDRRCRMLQRISYGVAHVLQQRGKARNSSCLDAECNSVDKMSDQSFKFHFVTASNLGTEYHLTRTSPSVQQRCNRAHAT